MPSILNKIKKNKESLILYTKEWAADPKRKWRAAEERIIKIQSDF